MSSLLDTLSNQLGGDALSQIARQLGTDQGKTKAAVAGALPVLISALSRNAAKPEGAASLLGALQRDHDGSVLNNLGSLFQNPEALGGSGILKHVLGGQRSQVETGLSQASGLDSAAVGKLLAMLAPLVMGALGKTQREKGFDVSDLAGMLAGERRQAKAALPAGVGGMLTSFLDADGDGDIKDDVARIGAGLLGKLFGGKR
jgi:hypothetical protein